MPLQGSRLQAVVLPGKVLLLSAAVFSDSFQLDAAEWKLLSLFLAIKLSPLVSFIQPIPNDPFEDDWGIFLILVC